MVGVKFCPIVPDDALSDLGTGCQMVLAQQYMKSQKYKDYYLNTRMLREYCILDNGAAEGSQVNLDTLITICNELMPTVVCLPDTIGNSIDTLDKFYAVFDKLSQFPEKVLFGFIPQGEDAAAYDSCYLKMRYQIQQKGMGRRFVPCISKYAPDRLGFAKTHGDDLQLWDIVHFLGMQHLADGFILARLSCSATRVYIDSALPYRHIEQDTPMPFVYPDKGKSLLEEENFFDMPHLWHEDDYNEWNKLVRTIERV